MKSNDKVSGADLMLFLEVMLATIIEISTEGNPEKITDDPLRLSMMAVLAAVRRAQVATLESPSKKEIKRHRKQRAAKIKLLSSAISRTLVKLQEVK